jgi:hypothetical protein
MSSVLLIVNEEAHARELSRVADYLLTVSDLQPVYFVEDRMKPFGVHRALAASKVETLTSEDFAAHRRPAKVAVPGLWRRLVGAFVTLMQGLAARLPAGGGRWMHFFRNIGASRDLLLIRFSVCEAALLRRPCVAVLLCEDNVELETAVWIAAAHRNGIRCVIVPFTIANTAEFLENHLYSTSLQLQTSLPNRLIGHLFPKWVTHFKDRKFLRVNYAKVAGFELLGLTPPNPWLLNSGFADAIAVESAAMHDYYTAAGIPANQLVMTGTLVDDAMSDVIAQSPKRRRALVKEAGLLPDWPLLLCAFPPDQHQFDRPGCEFLDFDDLVHFWGKCFADIKEWNIVVVRHPKTRIGDLDALCGYGVTVIDRDTASLIPLCDLYVASISATIRWAAACGKPVINYDVYRFDFEDYAGLDGVVLAQTREEFGRVLTAATGDHSYFASLQAAQRREAPRWGIHDGQSGRRLLTLIGGESPFWAGSKSDCWSELSSSRIAK